MTTDKRLAREARLDARKYLDNHGVAGAIRNLGLRLSTPRQDCPSDDSLFGCECRDAHTDVVGYGRAATAEQARIKAVLAYLVNDYLGE